LDRKKSYKNTSRSISGANDKKMGGRRGKRSVKTLAGNDQSDSRYKRGWEKRRGK